VRLAGRVVRHLSAEATLLSVLPPTIKDPKHHERIERFLAGGISSLSLLSVPATTLIRTGNIPEEISKEVQQGDYDLVVLGAPLPTPEGKISLSGVLGQTLSQITSSAILIVRSHYHQK